MSDDETRLDWATDLPDHNGWLRQNSPTERHWAESHRPRFGMLDGYHRDENGHYWHPSVAERFPMTRQYAETAVWPVMEPPSPKAYGVPPRHVSQKVYKARKRRTPVQKALLWSAIIIVVAATLAAAVPVAGLACLAHCPMP